MKTRWYWFLGIDRWDGGYQVGLGLVTIHRIDGLWGKRWLIWWNRD
jgi:hypothetical protein